jgi:hypothetical protein
MSSARLWVQIFIVGRMTSILRKARALELTLGALHALLLDIFRKFFSVLLGDSVLTSHFLSVTEDPNYFATIP